ncbi:hypothetical protein E2C01_069824 [Portunus trituberculatus]|uniref:Uncharacterized protein n=1 Tax=Portunus trituberculatus TaxID=210409 RepID=A0A5B7I1W0_PORTR|nr:hypothetical protein [Portunus trituberculatus]
MGLSPHSVQGRETPLSRKILTTCALRPNVRILPLLLKQERYKQQDKNSASSIRQQSPMN